MGILSTAEAADRLGVSVRRVQQMVKSGQLPAKQFGGSLMIEETDLALVNERPLGRPAKAKTATTSKTAASKKRSKK